MNITIKDGWYKEYIEQSSIPKDFAKYKDILDGLDESFLRNAAFISYTKKILFQPLGARATQQTLEGISSLLTIGNVVDSYVLLRKIRDNLFLDLFFLSETKAKANEFDNELCKQIFDEVKSGNKDLPSLDVLFNRIATEENNNDKKQAIARWSKGELTDDDRHKCFGYGAYWSYLKKQEVTKDICVFFSGYFDKLEKVSNNYVHSNGFGYIDNKTFFYNPEKFQSCVQDIDKSLKIILEFYVSSVFMINGTLIGTSDYVDYLDAKMTPPEGCQYNVQSTVYQLFSDIKKEKPDLYKYLFDHNNYGMNAFD
jgi:hypothetical protein